MRRNLEYLFRDHINQVFIRLGLPLANIILAAYFEARNELTLWSRREMRDTLFMGGGGASFS
jgi:hypothetical protein